jgi:hypothetical protein
MSKLHAGLLIAAAAMAGIYAIAANIATTTAAGFATAETTSHTRLVEFATAMKSAAVENSTARAKCKRLAGAERNDCDAEAAAAAEQRRARTGARSEFTGYVKVPANAGMNAPKGMREIDAALYRAHRQLPD